MKSLKVTTALVDQALTGVQLTKEETIKEFIKVAEINNLSLDYLSNNYNEFVSGIHRSIIEIIEEMTIRIKEIL